MPRQSGQSPVQLAREQFLTRLSAWQGHQAQAEAYRELDQERVLVLADVNARGRTSRVELGEALTRHAALFHIREGKVTRLVVYTDRALALADLGLTPEDEMQ